MAAVTGENALRWPSFGGEDTGPLGGNYMCLGAFLLAGMGAKAPTPRGLETPG